MNIFEHLIPDNAILGVGPLFYEPSANEADLLLYGKCRYVFDLHLAAHTTQVKSEWFAPKDNQEEKEKMKKWREDYFSIRERVAKMIGEQTDARKAHLEAVDKVEDDLRNVLSALVSEIQPAEQGTNVSVSLKVLRIEQHICDLVKLAEK